MYLRVARTGAASLSREAVEKLGNPDYVVVLVDRERGLFGIRAATKGESGARMLRRAAVGYTRTMRFTDLLHLAGARRRIGMVPLEFSEEEGLLIGKLADLQNLPPAKEPTLREYRKEKEFQGEKELVPF